MTHRKVDEIVNTNAQDACSAEVNIDGTPRVGVYVCADSGSHSVQIVVVQVQPLPESGWVDTEHVVAGAGSLPCIELIANAVRVKVVTPENKTSTSRVIIVISE